MDISLSDREKEVLEQVLETSIADIRSEITHTDDHSYKDQLNVKKDLLNHVLESVKQPEID